MPKLTQSHLKKILKYNPATGVFTWAEKIARKVIIGKPAGTKSHGYWVVTIARKRYLSHRLAVLYMSGRWPLNDIDHKDLNKGNNRWTNIRTATRSQNKFNCLKRANNTSGYKGVHWSHKNKNWVAQIYIRNRTTHLGCFSSPKKAHAAYCKAATKHYGVFARA